MSLRENLIKPFVVEAAKGHSCTVIFLHRFPQETTAEELPAKVLSAKLTKNHKTLAEQFPTVRWVFPYPKLRPHAADGRPRNQHWSGLSLKETEDLHLPFGPDIPYITQIIIQEAQLAGGLDKIVLGGQGESAIAAHDACTSFPELPAKCRQDENLEKSFMDRFFHNPAWNKLDQLTMAGFVGMHAHDGPATRDESDYILSRRTTSGRIVNHTILKQTPHKFIRGGYKTQTITWDGRRIDDFAWFLTSLGIKREGYDVEDPAPDPWALTPKQRPAAEKKETKPGMSAQQRHALEVMEDKKAEQEAKRRILMRIEEDKRNRRYRKEREREARRYAAGKDPDAPDAAGTPEAQESPGESDSTQRSATIIRQYEERPKAWEDWATMPDELRTRWEPKGQEDIGKAQLKALGIIKKEDS